MTLEDQLQTACVQLGLGLDLGFVASLDSGRIVVALARIRDLGAVNGMLIVRSYDDIDTLQDELLAAGYGYSVLSDPAPNSTFNVNGYARMFSDWGWAGSEDTRPAWLVTED